MSWVGIKTRDVCREPSTRVSFLAQPNSLEGPEPISVDPLANPEVHTLKRRCLLIYAA